MWSVSLSFPTVAALTLSLALLPVTPSRSGAAEMTTGSVQKTRFLSLGIGKSVVLDLPRDVKDVLVANPKVANAVVHSSQRAYVIGAEVGQTNIVFFNSDGQQIAAYDIAVTRDLNGIRAALKQTVPNADIRIEGLGDGVVLTGSVSSPHRGATGGRSRQAAGRGRRQGRQQHRRPQP